MTTSKIVLKLANGLAPGHIIFMDNFYTTMGLAIELKARGIGVTGCARYKRDTVK